MVETYNNIIDILKNDPDKNLKVISDSYIHDAGPYGDCLLEHLHHQREQKLAIQMIAERMWWCIANFTLQDICEQIEDYHDCIRALNRRINKLEHDLQEIKEEI